MGTVAAFHTDFFLTVRQKAFASSVHTHCGETDACHFQLKALTWERPAP